MIASIFDHISIIFNHNLFEADDFRNALELPKGLSETTLKSTNTIRYLGNLHIFFQGRPLRSPKNLAHFSPCIGHKLPVKTPQVALCQPWGFSVPKNKLLRSHETDFLLGGLNIFMIITIHKVVVCGYVGFNRHPTYSYITCCVLFAGPPAATNPATTCWKHRLICFHG